MGVSNSFCIHLRKNHLIILFALCFIRAWTHMGQYLAKNTSLGPKILIIMGVSKSFGSHKNGITTKATYSHCFLVGYWIKWAKNKSSCPNLAIFGPKINFLRGWGKTIGILFWYPHIREPIRHLFRVEDIERCGSNWPLGTKCAILTQKFGYLGPKFNILFWNRDFCQQGITPVHLGPPRKKFRFWAMGHFFGVTPVFDHFGLVSLRY